MKNGCSLLDEVSVEENGCFSSAKVKVTANSFDDPVSVDENGCSLPDEVSVEDNGCCSSAEFKVTADVSGI